MTKKEEQDIVVPVSVEPIAAGAPMAYAEAPTKQDLAAQQTTGPPIPPGHARFYCSKCRTPYDLPDKATSWRCMTCHTFNSTTPGECEWCQIL